MTSASAKLAKKRKTKNVSNDKLLLKKKTRDGKKARFLNNLEQNDSQRKRINSNVNKWFISLLILFGKENMLGKSIQLSFGVVRDKRKN